MPPIAFAVAIAVALSSAGALAACPDANQPKSHHTKTHSQTSADNCVNLTAVPQISAAVVANEPAPAAKTTPTFTLPPQPTYQGPTFGLSKPDPGVKPVPTVGYHWSLE